MDPAAIQTMWKTGINMINWSIARMDPLAKPMRHSEPLPDFKQDIQLTCNG